MQRAYSGLVVDYLVNTPQPTNTMVSGVIERDEGTVRYERMLPDGALGEDSSIHKQRT